MRAGSSAGRKWSFSQFVRRIILRRGDDLLADQLALPFEAVEKVLDLYVAGLMGREIAVGTVEDKRSQAAYTDTKTIYLPYKVGEFPEERDNFTLYKLMAAQKCAQIQFGTYHSNGYFHSLPDPSLFLDIYALVENERVEFLLSREFKGLRDDLALARGDAWRKRPPFQGLSKKAAVLEGILQRLLLKEGRPGLRRNLETLCGEGAGLVCELWDPGAQVADSIAVARQLYDRVSNLGGAYDRIPIVHYRGEIRLDRAEVVFRQAAAREILQAQERRPEVESQGKEQPGQRNRMVETMDFSPKRITVRDAVRGEGVLGAEHLDQVVWLDMDPPERANEVSLTDIEKDGAVLYDEWNYQWSAYRKEWCALRERLMQAGNATYVEKVLKKHHALVTQIRRQFEALRPDLRKLRKQSDGEEIDIDVVVESLLDQRAGNPPNENVYISRVGNKRDISVAFLVDLSGSVGGWIPEGRILDMEKESLILICEALQILNDKYAIYGFSSSTRKQCDFYVVKGFREAYDEGVRSRIAGMQPFNYTRMGVAVRHAIHYLLETESKVKLMILISDGKPNDFDGYASRYGVEDTRMALLEARQASIRTFCITIDTEARNYVPDMFGEGNYIIIDNVARLPARLPDMYRRLTT